MGQFFYGTVASYDPDKQHFFIKFENGDEEEFTHKMMKTYQCPNSDKVQEQNSCFSHRNLQQELQSDHFQKQTEIIDDLHPPVPNMASKDGPYWIKHFVAHPKVYQRNPTYTIICTTV